MNQVISFLRSIRKQPRRTRVMFFWAVVLVIVPLALYVWSISFYQTLEQVTLGQQGQESAQQSFGRQVVARAGQALGQAGTGLSYLGQAVVNGATNLRIGSWIMDRVRLMQGHPEIQPASPDVSSVTLPVASPESSTTPLLSPSNF